MTANQGKDELDELANDDATPPDSLPRLLLFVSESLDREEPFLDIPEQSQVLRHSNRYMVESKSARYGKSR